MIPADILNADMATLGRWMRGGLLWWVDELRSMMPQGWLAGRHSALALLLSADGTRVERVEGGMAESGAFPVRLDPRTCLIRHIALPAMSRRDMEAALELEGERYFPMPSGECLYAVGQPGIGEATGIAALPLATARKMAVALNGAGVRPLSLHVDAAGERLDFLPAMRRVGLIADNGSARSRWWAVVAFLFLLNAALFAWRDEAMTARLRERVEDQQPAVMVAQRIRSQMRKAQVTAAQAAQKRGRRDAATLLAAITRALPDGAWVQRYQQEGDTVRLSGYRMPEADIVGPLRKIPQIRSVRSGQAEQAAVSTAGQPFDLVLTMNGR